ncbi:hypothetical protein PMO31116_04352 [Pandoraea morbifera]|uniref:Uncharacterized protein n=1 Tax=Pandoraea morbifera TaxID=2508300 RepID=A0A5E4YB83_9BURK|nr:hypothetical protein [Pandoraea morbifera]VVE45688.1 hypothetical protein PMO31116_04352 [Pandoraea morbifera]
MFKITVVSTRSAMFCLACACIASSAQADVTGAGIPNIAVSDALLATTRAANLQQSVVAHLSGAKPTALAPVNSTLTTANNVRLWDEVVPPAPSPKPTQASNAPQGQLRTTVAIAQPPTRQFAPGMQATSFKVDASTVRVGR